MGFFSDLGGKLKVFIAEPSKSMAVVSKAITQSLTGQDVERNVIPAETVAAAKITPADIITTPLTAVGAGAAGLVGTVGASILGEETKAGKFVGDHPGLTAAGLGAALVAPGAVAIAGANLLNQKPPTAVANGLGEGSSPVGRAAGGAPRKPTKRVVGRKRPGKKHASRSRSRKRSSASRKKTTTNRRPRGSGGSSNRRAKKPTKKRTSGRRTSRKSKRPTGHRGSCGCPICLRLG